MKKTPDDMMIEKSGVQKLKTSRRVSLGLHVFMCMWRCPHVHFVVLMLVGRRSFSYRCSSILRYCH